MARAMFVLLLAVLGQVAFSQVYSPNAPYVTPYKPHAPYVAPQVVPVTLTETVTQTQTVRLPVTSDVWVSTVTHLTVTATQLSTRFSFAPDQADTVTSVLAITNTPVSIVRNTVGVNPVRTVVSVHTSFVTETERKDLYHSVTHVDIHHEIRTIPVKSYQTLVQRETSTTKILYTVTVTSTTHGYGYRH